MRVTALHSGSLTMAVLTLIGGFVAGCAPQMSGSDHGAVSLAPAGQYDGQWIAAVPAQGGCNFNSQLTIDVHGRSMTGVAINRKAGFR